MMMSVKSKKEHDLTYEIDIGAVYARKCPRLGVYGWLLFVLGYRNPLVNGGRRRNNRVVCRIGFYHDLAVDFGSPNSLAQR